MTPNNIITMLKDYSINYIIIGSYALYMLNRKYDLNINFNLSEKDFDILVNPSNNFDTMVLNIPHITYINRRYYEMYKIQNQNFKKIDIFLNLKFRNMKIQDQFINGVTYNNIIFFCEDGLFDGEEVKFLNLEAYYGIIKNTGLKKYQYIIQAILDKYPDIKDSVTA